MAAMRAVNQPEEDPKTGRKRPKSGVSFPYFDLDSAVEVARVMHNRAGGSCDLAALAAYLRYSGVKNGSFRMRVSATKMFGVVEEVEGQPSTLRVSQLGRNIVAPVTPGEEARAKTSAFLSVELFRKVFDLYNGSGLPEEVGLQNLLRDTYQVVPDRVIPTVRIMLDSAEQAGFFEAAGNRSRMVMPAGGAAGTSHAPPPPPKPIGEPPLRHGGGGGNGGDYAGIDPFILEFVRKLPPGGTKLSEKRRAVYVASFTGALDVVYPEAEASE